MAKFYFDTNDGSRESRDEIGLEVDDVSAARRAAIGTLPLIAEDVLPDGDEHVVSVTVRDDAGTPVFRAILQLKTEWLQLPPTPQS